MPYHQHPYEADIRMVFALEHANAQILALIRLNVRRLFRFEFSEQHNKSCRNILVFPQLSKNRIKRRQLKNLNKIFLQLVYTTMPRKMKLHNAFRFPFLNIFLLAVARTVSVRFHSNVNKNDHLIVYRFESRSILYLHVCVLLGLFDIKFN